MAKATAKKQSKYDKVMKLPISFEQAMALMAKSGPKPRAKRSR